MKIRHDTITRKFAMDDLTRQIALRKASRTYPGALLRTLRSSMHSARTSEAVTSNSLYGQDGRALSVLQQKHAVRKNGYPYSTKIANLCIKTGASRSVLRCVQVNRIQFRNDFHKGLFTGYKKSSW
jgi:ribosomal protein S14